MRVRHVGDTPYDSSMSCKPPLPAWRALQGPHTWPERQQAQKNSLSTAPPPAFPRKNSPNAPENSVFRPFWACRANFFALAPTIRPSRVNFFAHRTRPRGDVETNDTSATKKQTENTHFSPAKAMAVSVEARPARAKVSPVSSQRSHKAAKASPVSPRWSDALDTEPMHQIAQHCTGN